ncbi:hypothetical protein C8R46DRAFT_1346807 [Mycena filopes]|nr:hypothetical protein C8R46DRAFT_1346807 [Mycena filopes]
MQHRFHSPPTALDPCPRPYCTPLPPPSTMAYNIFAPVMARASFLHKICKTTSSMEVYLPLAERLVEICVASAPESRRKAAALVLHAVHSVEAVVKNGVNLQLPPKVLEGLEKFESVLAEILRHIESIPEQSNKSNTSLSSGKFRLRSAYLRTKLDGAHRTLLKKPAKQRRSPASRNEYILEFAAITTRAAGAICDLPILNLLKPVVEITALICDTAKMVNSNGDAALEIAKHAQSITNSVVDRASTGVGDETSLSALRLTLEEIQRFLDVLKRRRRLTAFALAAKDKERFIRLNSGLDRALELFTSTQTIRILEFARANEDELASVKAVIMMSAEGKTAAIEPTSAHCLFFFDKWDGTVALTHPVMIVL